MSLELSQLVPTGAPPAASRFLAESDAAALAELMLDAYRGTVDDHGEGSNEARDEVQRTFAGSYGPMLWSASFAVEGDLGGPPLLSAAVLTLWRGLPLLAFALTHPRAQGRGLAGGLIQQAVRALAAQGHARLELIVTCGNLPAERLYERLGFQEVERR